jgi:predicted type IV restriction endonuclease
MEELSRFIESLRGKKSIYNFDEDLTKQAIVLKILDILGWDTFNPEEVSQEHRITGGKVDYALTVNKKNLLFIEAKSINAPLDSHEEQLLSYSFHAGVELALLTNGTEW